MAAEFEPLEFPPTVRWGQRGGAFLEYHKGRCRWCAKDLSPSRGYWCRDSTCVRDFIRVSTWAALRVYVHGRDGGICQRCSDPVGKRWQVDHITPVRNGGTDDPANLRLLCHDCHVVVGYEQRRAEKPQLDMIA